MFITARDDLDDICGIIKNIGDKTSSDFDSMDEDSSEEMIPTTVLEKQSPKKVSVYITNGFESILIRSYISVHQIFKNINLIFSHLKVIFIN